MKVMCIDAANNKPLPIAEGEVYEVLSEDTWFGMSIYILTHAPNTPLSADRFVPISDIDETEMIQERELVEV